MFRLPLCGVFVLLIVGCNDEYFRAETTWHADGKIDRAIYQPLEFFPQETRSSWRVVRSVNEVASEAFTGSIRALPIDEDPDSRHVAAWGSFAAPEQLPDALRIPAADPTKFGTLKRDCAIEDLGLVTEYRWDETLTDVVSLSDMSSARRELTAIVADVIELATRENPSYQADKFIFWIRDDASRWFEELHVELVEAGLRGWLKRDRWGDSPLPGRWADISARYGLVVRRSDGAPLADEQLASAIGGFLLDKVRSTVTDADGKPLDEPQAQAFLASIGLSEPEKLTWNSTPAIDKAIVTRFGNGDIFKQEMAELVTRLLGVYRLGSFLPRRPMHFELTIPGQIVETTGERVGEHTIVYAFDAPEAFPFGYAMTARSLDPNDAVQKKIFGSVRIGSLEQLSLYAKLMHADASLRDVMERCATAGSLKPFDEYEREIKNSGNEDAVLHARIRSLRNLLTRR